MPEIRIYTVTQVRKVEVKVVPKGDETYEQAALRIAHEGFENPGDFREGMALGMRSAPAITEMKITRER